MQNSQLTVQSIWIRYVCRNIVGSIRQAFRSQQPGAITRKAPAEVGASDRWVAAPTPAPEAQGARMGRSGTTGARRCSGCGRHFGKHGARDGGIETGGFLG